MIPAGTRSDAILDAAHDAAMVIAAELHDDDARAMVAARLSDMLSQADIDFATVAVLDALGVDPGFRHVAQGFAAWAHHVAAGEDAQAAAWWPLLSAWVPPETLDAAIFALPRYVGLFRTLLLTPPAPGVH